VIARSFVNGRTDLRMAAETAPHVASLTATIRKPARVWRTYTIPAPGEKGSETWPNKEFSNAWKLSAPATCKPVVMTRS